MGLDGLGSASYGPEAALSILAATGAAGLGAIGPITWVILILLAILFFSYWQTIAAYPNNGGSYIVAKDNLGALTSAIPVLHPYTLWLCLGSSPRSPS
jgi:amino acid transporter